MTASRVEAVFDVLASRTLSDSQRARLLRRAGPRLAAVAQDARSQTRNRELALERLRERIAVGLQQPRVRKATRPTRASAERRLAGKRQASQRKLARRPPRSDEDG